MKTIEQHFADWETDAFGFGYGTGEEHVLGALKAFFGSMRDGRSYNYRVLEAALTPTVAWLLINHLCRNDVIEYGTSPRGGWLTPHGEKLAAYFRERTLDQIVDATNQPDNYVHCYVEHCNCDDGDCRPLNPFWPKEPLRAK